MFEAEVSAADFEPLTEVGRSSTTAWHQGSPSNNTICDGRHRCGRRRLRARPRQRARCCQLHPRRRRAFGAPASTGGVTARAAEAAPEARCSRSSKIDTTETTCPTALRGLPHSGTGFAGPALFEVSIAFDMGYGHAGRGRTRGHVNIFPTILQSAHRSTARTGSPFAGVVVRGHRGRGQPGQADAVQSWGTASCATAGGHGRRPAVSHDYGWADSRDRGTCWTSSARGELDDEYLIRRMVPRTSMGGRDRRTPIGDTGVGVGASGLTTTETATSISTSPTTAAPT